MHMYVVLIVCGAREHSLRCCNIAYEHPLSKSSHGYLHRCQMSLLKQFYSFVPFIQLKKVLKIIRKQSTPKLENEASYTSLPRCYEVKTNSLVVRQPAVDNYIFIEIHITTNSHSGVQFTR